MPVTGKFYLRVWESDFGLPTVDPESLIALTTLKMCKADVSVSYASCPQYLSIPSISQNNKCLAVGFEFVNEVMKICNIDANLDSRNQSNSMAYKRYFLESFEPLFFYDCWIRKSNYLHTTRPWFMAAVTFPFNYFYIKAKYKEAIQRFQCLKKGNTEEVYVAELHKLASCCLDDFNNMLSDGRTYIFGSTPSELDAVVYSYIVIALNLPLSDVHFQNTIKGYRVLCKYVRNITRLYYPELEVKYKYVQPEDTLKDSASNLTLLITAICASSLMIFYAHINGIFRVKFWKE
ncbi:hypothetical protein FQA39_LY15453 [Lamprigera yunnana]|nr:hypothetical protein FQA39_LY15453 [Lamprigera yunnana]